MDSLNSRSRLHKRDHPMRPGGEARSVTISSMRISVAVGLLIAVVGFVFHLGLELRLDRLEVFDQCNVFFDADANDVLANLAYGSYEGLDYRRGLVHPNLGRFFAVPIGVFVKMLSTVSPDDLDVMDLRRQLALLIVPASAALFYLVFHRVLLRLRFSLLLASLLTLFAFVSFSQMLFGSIPESYAISNLAIALAYLLFVTPRYQRGTPGLIAWTAAGLFATGITVTNVVPVAILFWLRKVCSRDSIVVSAAKALGMAALILALTFALNVMGNYSAGFEPRSLGQEARFVQTFGTTDVHSIARKVLTFPALLVNSVFAPVPNQQPNKYALRVNPEARHPFRFTFDYDGKRGSTTPPLSLRNVAGTALFLLLLVQTRAFPIDLLQKLSKRRVSRRFPVTALQAGIVVGGAMMMAAFLVDWLGLGGKAGFGGKQLVLLSTGLLLVLSGLLLPHAKRIRQIDNADRPLFLLSWGSLAIIGFNWVLHSFWGLDRFLYSQHWHVSLMFLLAVLAATQLGSFRVCIVLVGASVILVGANNLVVLRTMLMTLWAN